MSDTTKVKKTKKRVKKKTLLEKVKAILADNKKELTVLGVILTLALVLALLG